MMNGEDNFLRMFASPTAYFKCFLAIRVLFLNALRANIYFVRRSLALNTFPKEPDPISLIISNEDIPTLQSSAIVEKFYFLSGYEL